MPDSTFSPDFATARLRFRAAAERVGAALDAIAHPQAGPHGEPLSTDLAWIGSKDAAQVLVLVSGTHGVEGYCGSAAQLDWLEGEEARKLPDGAAVLLVHAINPYGFAWDRRVTHENVDLNRNWVDFASTLPANPAYEGLATALCPTEWSDAVRAETRATLAAFVADHGMDAFLQAVSGGQHGDPAGLFYGGQAPCWSRRALTDVFQTRLVYARQVAMIDIHTGLGSAGFGGQMTAARDGSSAFRRARRWYGGLVTPIGAEGSASTALAGDWLSAVPALLPQAEVTAMALEFGTASPLVVLEALRADAWLHAHGDPRSAEGEAIRAQVRAAFALDTDLWRGRVLGQSLLAARQALAGLTTDA